MGRKRKIFTVNDAPQAWLAIKEIRKRSLQYRTVEEVAQEVNNNGTLIFWFAGHTPQFKDFFKYSLTLADYKNGETNFMYWIDENNSKIRTKQGFLFSTIKPKVKVYVEEIIQTSKKQKTTCGDESAEEASEEAGTSKENVGPPKQDDMRKALLLSIESLVSTFDSHNNAKELMEENKQLKEENKQLQEENKQLQEENKQLKNNVSELQEHVEMCDEKFKAMNKQRTVYKTYVDDMKPKLTDVLTQVAQLKYLLDGEHEL